MHGMRFGELHSFEDLNLILSKVDLPPAAVKTTYVDNPGGDGSWDLTEALGKVNYKDRNAKFTFSVLPEDDWEAKKTEVSNILNGRRFKITLDKDPEYYWDGRCSVDQYSSNKKMRQIVVGATVAPYKLKQEKTRVFVPFCGNNLFDKNNLPLVYGGYGCTLSTLGSGVRLSWTDGQWTIYVAKLYPIQMLIGKTITLSAKIAATGGAEPRIAIGYVSADGSRRFNGTFLKSTGSVAFTIGEDAAAYDNLGIWLYANAGTDPANVSEGAYVDYTDIQIELGDTATEYEPYVASVPTGKNLFDIHDFEASQGTIIERFENGVIYQGKLSNSDPQSWANGWLYLNYKGGHVPLKAGDIVTLSVDYTLLELAEGRTEDQKVGVYTQNTETLSVLSVIRPKLGEKRRIYCTHTINKDGNYGMSVTSNSNKVKIENPQIALGTTATEYEPFTTDHNITLTNGRKTACPLIVCTDAANINVNGAEFALGEGANKILDFSLEEGENTVTIGGSGAATIIYQEGDL